MGIPTFNDKSAANQDVESSPRPQVLSPHSPTAFLPEEQDYQYASQNAQNRHFRQLSSHERCRKYACALFIILLVTVCAIIFACALSAGYYLHRNRAQTQPKDIYHASPADPHQWVAHAPSTEAPTTTTVNPIDTISESDFSSWFRHADINSVHDYESITDEGNDAATETTENPPDYQDYYDEPHSDTDEDQSPTETETETETDPETQTHTPAGFWDLVNLMRKATRGEIRRVRIRFNMEPSQTIDN